MKPENAESVETFTNNLHRMDTETVDDPLRDISEIVFAVRFPHPVGNKARQILKPAKCLGRPFGLRAGYGRPASRTTLSHGL